MDRGITPSKSRKSGMTLSEMVIASVPAATSSDFLSGYSVTSMVSQATDGLP
jgi:hypothetical protein